MSDIKKTHITDKNIRVVIKNIAEDFRYTNETDDYALLFYKIDTSGLFDQDEKKQMEEYCTTGLEELQNDPLWKKSLLDENPSFQEEHVLKNMRVIKAEYEMLLNYLSNN